MLVREVFLEEEVRDGRVCVLGDERGESGCGEPRGTLWGLERF